MSTKITLELNGVAYDSAIELARQIGRLMQATRLEVAEVYVDNPLVGVTVVALDGDEDEAKV